MHRLGKGEKDRQHKHCWGCEKTETPLPWEGAWRWVEQSGSELEVGRYPVTTSPYPGVQTSEKVRLRQWAELHSWLRRRGSRELGTSWASIAGRLDKHSVANAFSGAQSSSQQQWTKVQTTTTNNPKRKKCILQIYCQVTHGDVSGQHEYFHSCKNHGPSIMEKHLRPEGRACWPCTPSHHVHKKSETGNLPCEWQFGPRLNFHPFFLWDPSTL